MKRILLALTIALATQSAFAQSVAAASHGHHGAPAGMSFGKSSGQSTSGASNGNGGRYSMVDSYQPWPESEMRQFEKPHFTPYDGK